MTAVQYLPLSEIPKVQNFVQFASPQGTASLLQTQLNTTFGATAGNIQCMLDTTTGQTTWCLVIVNDNLVFSVPPNNQITYYNGQWAQYTPSQLTAQFTQYFTS
jgi:hypothetical protein